MPYGWSLDFDKCPVHYTPKASLIRYLAVRGYQPRTRHDIFKIVERMRVAKDITIFTEEEAKKYLPRNVRYAGLEVLLPDSGAAKWNSKSITVLKKTKCNAKYVRKIFGKRNGVRKRALQRLKNGHFFIDTLQTTDAKTIELPDKPSKRVHIIRCEALASMRRNIYTVNIVLDQNGKYMPAPFLRCTCAEGNLFCAHMLGLIFLCGLVQRNPNWNDMSDVSRHMPTHVLQIQRCIIPVEILFALNKRR